MRAREYPISGGPGKQHSTPWKIRSQQVCMQCTNDAESDLLRLFPFFSFKHCHGRAESSELVYGYESTFCLDSWLFWIKRLSLYWHLPLNYWFLNGELLNLIVVTLFSRIYSCSLGLLQHDSFYVDTLPAWQLASKKAGQKLPVFF